MSIADSKERITQIEQEARERYEALQGQYKDHLSPEQVANKISIAEAKYKDYLSPNAVQELKQEHAQELVMKEQNHAKALETKDTEHTKTLQEKQKEIDALKNENTQKDENINGLEGQITQYTQELDKVKPELATLKTTNQQLQQENLKLKPSVSHKSTDQSKAFSRETRTYG
ncbi:hypothetical protein [Helicobacter felistomachi]|uniref:hypothetical protein n=1 Tax=Helicobacter felistomachi TaxID=3040201 RepID=UPI00257331B9|nr:hypothetical protein [Helicobacter sp. NHP21005]